MGKNSVLVTDENGYVHILKGKCIGAGGEGEIYEIENEPDVVAKIYYPKYRTQDRQEKIRAMLDIHGLYVCCLLTAISAVL